MPGTWIASHLRERGRRGSPMAQTAPARWRAVWYENGPLGCVSLGVSRWVCVCLFPWPSCGRVFLVRVFVRSFSPFGFFPGCGCVSCPSSRVGLARLSLVFPCLAPFSRVWLVWSSPAPSVFPRRRRVSGLVVSCSFLPRVPGVFSSFLLTVFSWHGGGEDLPVQDHVRRPLQARSSASSRSGPPQTGPSCLGYVAVRRRLRQPEPGSEPGDVVLSGTRPGRTAPAGNSQARVLPGADLLAVPGQQTGTNRTVPGQSS